ncbi:uncharacterized protein BCR38DRAFT_405829 [Pseudomassariella vexata]|uniref:Uncharacterized protein n=1 Tax=Pseudomassariella vexata TaxID=1141098 RepID=A0A1Y2EF63_9PEZI|nr:uncharacterized protein BCR38DRAFT_405829 [Pseudomassariella vexata]ORY70199.1 hypothetical protein BCR38DRAFT_405829 [Pseudomassariella vexata]
MPFKADQEIINQDRLEALGGRMQIMHDSSFESDPSQLVKGFDIVDKEQESILLEIGEASVLREAEIELGTEGSESANIRVAGTPAGKGNRPSVTRVVATISEQLDAGRSSAKVAIKPVSGEARTSPSSKSKSTRDRPEWSGDESGQILIRQTTFRPINSSGSDSEDSDHDTLDGSSSEEEEPRNKRLVQEEVGLEVLEVRARGQERTLKGIMYTSKKPESLTRTDKIRFVTVIKKACDQVP